MAKKILLFAFVFFALCNSAYVESETAYPDFQSYTVEELLELRDLLTEELLARGYVPYIDLERGAKGEDVIAVQERLQELGFFTGSINGKYDSETQKACKRFEKANGLANDGNASRDDQRVLFDAAAVGIVSDTPAQEPEPTLDPMADVFAAYGEFDYEACLRNPEEHRGEKVMLKGEVVQVLGNRKEGFQIRFATSGYDDVVFVVIKDDLGFNILDGDRLTIYATLTNTFTYESTWKVEITIPAAISDYVVMR